MNLTDEKFWNSERDRLTSRRDGLRAEAATINARLTELTKETALLDDLLVRLDAHLPATQPDITPLKRETA